MELNKTQDLFLIANGDTVTKRNLFDLIQYSKVESSPYWSGQDFIIGNTPQQGINWVGQLPAVKAVIIKAKHGSYAEDGWADDTRKSYHYSFKSRNSLINYKEKANDVLIKQQQHLYPVLLFTDIKNGWKFEGSFSVSQIEDNYVVLQRDIKSAFPLLSDQNESQYQEGGRCYVTHLMAERNQNVVKILKNTKCWICEICNTDFNDRYGVPYIEAHHIVPMTTYSGKHTITPQDFAMLCPNCHKAVHIYMKSKNLSYHKIKAILSQNS